MNYIAEIRAFYDWLEGYPQVNGSCISLWHALMYQANKSGWKREFSVAVATLELRSGLKRGAVYTARKTLRELGAIGYRERGSNLASVYSMHSMCLFIERKLEHTAAHTGVRSGARGGERTGEPLYKQNDVKQNVNNNVRAWTKGAAPVAKIRFSNYEQHVRDYDEIDRLAERRIRELIKKEGDV